MIQSHTATYTIHTYTTCNIQHDTLLNVHSDTYAKTLMQQYMCTYYNIVLIENMYIHVIAAIVS